MSSIPTFSTCTLKETHQNTLADNRATGSSLIKCYRAIINSLPKEPVEYAAIESFNRRYQGAYEEAKQLAFSISPLSLGHKTPVNSPTFLINPSMPREYCVLDRLNLDPPLLSSRINSKTPKDYLELIEPRTSLECYVLNMRLKNLALKVIESIAYIETPIQSLSHRKVNPWISKQAITMPRDTSKFILHHICHGSLKLEQLDESIQGGLSVVSKTRLNDRNFALKAPKEKKDFLKPECALLMALDGISPHIITLKAVSNSGLFLPYANHSLMTLAKTEKINDPRLIKHLFLGVAKGLFALHEKGLTHKDVKLDNILIIDDEAVLCDFGLTCVTAGDYNKAGTQEYGSPECFNPKAVLLTNKIDSWSFGICLLTIIYGGFFKIDERSLGWYLLKSPRKNLNPLLELLKKEPRVNQRDPEGAFLEIVKSCLDINPKDRPSMEKIIQQLESTHL